MSRQLALPLAAQLLIDTHGGAAYGLVALSDLVSDRFRWSLVIGNTCSRTHFVLARQAKHLPHEQSVDSICSCDWVHSINRHSSLKRQKAAGVYSGLLIPLACTRLVAIGTNPSSSQIDLCDIGRQALTDDPRTAVSHPGNSEKKTRTPLSPLSLSLFWFGPLRVLSLRSLSSLVKNLKIDITLKIFNGCQNSLV